MADRRQFITRIAAVSTVGIAGCADTVDDGDGGEFVSDFSRTVSSVGGETIEGMAETDIPDYAELRSVTFECQDGIATTRFEMSSQVPEAVGGDEEIEFVAMYDLSKPGDDTTPAFIGYTIDVSDGQVSADLINADEPTVTHEGSTIELEFSLENEIGGAVGAYYEDEDEVPSSIGAQAITHYTERGELIQWVPSTMETRFDDEEWISVSI